MTTPTKEVLIIIAAIFFASFAIEMAWPTVPAQPTQPAPVPIVQTVIPQVSAPQVKTVYVPAPVAPIVQSQPTVPAQPTISDVIAKWKPSIVLIACGLPDGSTIFGSGTIFKFSDGGYGVMTNRHVVNPTINGVSTFVTICVGGSGSVPTYTWKTTEIGLNPAGADAAELKIANPDATTLTNVAPIHPFCATAPSLGDEVVVLGYPVNGGGQDITATEGIISSIENNYYVTSAKVDHGNSGGAAIDVKNNCYLGIPTYVNTDIESLARILKWQAFQ
jgi:hypothetical protein